MPLNAQCRTCKSNTDTIFSIFSEENINNEIILFSKMISICTSVIIEKSELLPTIICLSCKEEIIQAYKFRKKALEADKYFRESWTISSKNGNDINTYEEPSRFEEVIIKSEDEMQITNKDLVTESIMETEFVIEDTSLCFKDGSISSDSSEEWNDIKEKDNSSEDSISQVKLVVFPHKCIICSKKFKESSDLLRHVKDTHTDFMKKKTRKQKVFTTKIGEESDNDESGPVNSTNNTDLNSEVNNEKELTIKIKKDLTTKRCRIKRLSEKTKCPHCKKSYKNVTSLEKHLKDGHIEENSTFARICNICGKGYKKKSTFHDHYRKHFPEKCYQCEICERLFSNRSNYEQHKAIHSSEKKFKCELCEYRCTTKYSIGIHMRSHSDHRPYKCDICGFAFKVKTLLVNHMANHTGEGAFKCGVCAKVYNHASHLKNHMLSHTDHRAFTCETCGKAFKYRKNLTAHIRIHTGEKPHVCGLCGQDFTHWSTFHKHLEKQHPDSDARNMTRLTKNQLAVANAMSKQQSTDKAENT